MLPKDGLPTFHVTKKKNISEMAAMPFPCNGPIIVFVWSQHDGGNVEQRTMAKVPSKTL